MRSVALQDNLPIFFHVLLRMCNVVNLYQILMEISRVMFESFVEKFLFLSPLKGY